jgi:DNA-binding transcriptional ArsR family regulator
MHGNPTSDSPRDLRRRLRPDPTRDAIVDAMSTLGKPLSATMLSNLLGRTVGATSYHLRTLAEAGIVDRVGERQGRRANTKERLYALASSETTAGPAVGHLLAACDALTLLDAVGDARTAVVDTEATEELGELIELIKPRVRAIILESMWRRDETEAS